jgi:hypothetical protein
MKRRTYVLWKKLLTRLLLIVVIIGAFYVYFRTGFFTLHRYEITGAPEAYQARLQESVRYLADQRLYKILPGNRSISYHDDEIRTLVMETLPNTKDISIHPTRLHTLSIKLTSYEPVFSVSGTHAIARDGVVYREIVPLDPYPRLSISTSTSLYPSTLADLSVLVKNLSTVLFDVRYVVIDEFNDIRLYDEHKQKAIILSISSDMPKVWSNIVSAIDTDPLRAKLQAGALQLEYIDVRFGNKVFYKFTNGVNTAIILDTNVPSTSTTTPQ